jgi:hypothetical protein
MRLLFSLSFASLIVSAIIKYLAPELIDLENFPQMRMQAIAICAVSLPVLFYGMFVWLESAD